VCGSVGFFFFFFVFFTEMEELQGQCHRQMLLPQCHRMEYAREWGPCVLGLDQAVRRGPLPSLAPPVFCGIISPCFHEASLDSMGLGSRLKNSTISGVEQDRLARVIRSDSYIAWMLRTTSCEVVNGVKCGMGILEHTTVSSMIKEALAAGIDIRCVRVSTYSDPVRFRDFLFHAFPSIVNIHVYPKSVVISSSAMSALSATSSTPSLRSSGETVTDDMMTESPTGSEDDMDTPCGQCLPMPAILCAASVVSQSARDELSKRLLFRQRQNAAPIARSPLSSTVNAPSGRRDRGAGGPTFFGEPMVRSRPSLDEEYTIRCVPYAGSEYGESHCGLMPSARTLPQSQSVPIGSFDFFPDEDESEMIGLASPKRLRVVPCSPTVFTCEDSLPCVCPTVSRPVQDANAGTGADPSCSPPYMSSSLTFSSSTGVPVYHPLFGVTSPM